MVVVATLTMLRDRRGQATLEWLGVIVACVALVSACMLGLREWAGAKQPYAASLAEAAARRPLLAGGMDGLLPAGDGRNATIVGIALAEDARHIRERMENWSPQIMVFTDGQREPWCADFVSWVLRAAGKPLTQGVGGWRVAGAEAIRDLFRSRHRFAERAFAHPEPGDVIVYRYPWSWHVGIVVAASEAGLTTVEGNSGGVGGLEGVVRHERIAWRANPFIVGFGRP